MNVPAGVAGHTPLGSMFLWDVERLQRAGKWRADANNPGKMVAARFARVVLALRDLKDASSVMEFSAFGGILGPRSSHGD